MIERLTDSVLGRLAAIRQRVRQVVWTSGLARLVLVTLGAVVPACLADYWFHLDDSGVRLLVLLAIAGAAGWTVWRWLVTPLSARLTDLDVAMRIEERYPGFRESLASTVQFVEQSANPRVGSPVLQRAVVTEASRRLETLDLNDLVRTTGMRRLMWGAAGLAAAAVLLAALQPARTSLALRRLLFPLGAPAWPRATNLRLLDADLQPLADDPALVLQVPRGETYRFHAENATGKLPARVQLETRPAGSAGPVASETLRAINVPGAVEQFRDVAVGQIPAPRVAVEFRVVGGDDRTMPWRLLKVVNPPTVENLQLILTPPEYSRKPVEILPTGAGHVAGLVGTTIDLQGTASRPVASATVRIRDRERIPLALGDDQRSLSGRFSIADPGLTSWWLELRDLEGIQSSDLVRYEIRGIADAEPEVTIQNPPSDLQVTATALVPVQVQSQDDLGLATITIRFQVDDRAPQEIPLFAGQSRPQELTVEHLWNLAPLELTPGSRVTFFAEATDDYINPADGSRHVRRSVTRTLTVVSDAEKNREIERAQGGLLHELEQAARQERQAQEQTRALELQVEKAGSLRSEDLDALKRTELLQREVASEIGNPALGLAHRTREILNELRNNQLVDPATERRLESIAAELERLSRDALPPVEQSLTQARKVAEQSPVEGATKELQEELREAGQEQSAVLESLEELQRQLSQWRSERDISQELGNLTREQKSINTQTSELQQRTLSQQKESLSPQDQADIARLAERQKEQAEQWQRLEAKLDEQLQSPQAEETSPANAALRDTLDEARRQEVAGQMRDAASEIQENRMGQATRTQQEVLKKLQKLAGTLEQKRDEDEATLVKRLEQAQATARDLSEQQQELNEQLAAAQNSPPGPERDQQLERLRQQQKKLREETARLARLLKRSGSQRAGDAAEQAGARMNEAEEQLEENDLDDAEREMQEALDDLEQAEQEVAEERREAAERLAEELLEKMADELKAMIGRQQTALDESRRLEGLHQVSGKWSRAQALSLRQLAENQRNLQQETAALADKLSPARVFSLALRGAARSMQKAAERIGGKDVGSTTQRLQDSARQRFVELVEAIAAKNEQKKNAQAENQPSGEQDSGEQPGGPPGDSVSAIAQLKILVTLQREVLERTAELDALKHQPGHEWSSGDQTELEQLSSEQDQLGDLARELSETVAASEEEEDADDGDADAPPAGPLDATRDLPDFRPAKPGTNDRDEQKPRDEPSIDDLPDPE